tara:strand:+ start:439 stop:636 length:198 start_codon:yes stop_codon:yes gene_type:complete
MGTINTHNVGLCDFPSGAKCFCPLEDHSRIAEGLSDAIVAIAKEHGVDPIVVEGVLVDVAESIGG